MKANVNGSERELDEGTTVAQLLHEVAAPQTGIAVAVNGKVVRGSLHESTVLLEGDAVEIVRAVSGG